jgi:tRNA nucleotidyltransferase/poly(A) polymerase
MVVPPEIERLAEVFKSDVLKDLQHEIQTPGKPNRNKIGKKIADMTAKSRQDLRKKGVLQLTGRKLYVVGGVVRDWLINHFHGLAYPPDDWDLATDASVDSFKLIVKAGIEARLLPDDTVVSVNSGKFGNVQIVISGKSYSITTFPFTGYADAPRMYLDSLRRNFNVNALYYSIDEKKIYDFHTGIADIYRRTPQFVGKTRDKLKDENGPLYPLIYVRLHSRMNSKNELDRQIKHELSRFIMPHDINRADVYKELYKGVKQSIDKAKYFKLLEELGLLKQIFPSLKLNPHPQMGEMTTFPQVIAQVLQPNWNNLGHVYEVLHALEFNQREIHDISFLLKLPHYPDEISLKADRLHTGLSDRAIEQYVKTNALHNGKWIMSVIKNTKRNAPPTQQMTHNQFNPNSAAHGSEFHQSST